MQDHQEAAVETSSTTRKDAWSKPEVVAVTPITDAQGLGGAGFDFASEVS